MHHTVVLHHMLMRIRKHFLIKTKRILMIICKSICRQLINKPRQTISIFFVNNLCFFQMSTILFQKSISGAKIPWRATSGSAGFDLFAAQDKVIPAWGRGAISTGIKVFTFLFKYIQCFRK